MQLRKLCAVGAAVALPLLAPGVAAAQDGSFEFQLDEFNNTGASGTATLTPMSGGGLHVQIESTGLTPNAPHAQHIHGGFDGHDFMCPDMSADADGDGFVSTEEGLPAYGGIQISLTTSGDTTPTSGLAVDRMPTADADGTVSYDRMFTAAELPAGTVEQLANLHIVQHGLDANGNGTYDLEALGESTFAKSLGVTGIPSEATHPATCGMVAGAAAAMAPHGGVDTGDGSAAGGPAVAGWAVAGAAAVAVGGAVLRRRARESS